MEEEQIVIERTLCMTVTREGAFFEIEQNSDGTLTIRDGYSSGAAFIHGIRPEDLARFLDLIRAGGTNGND